MEPESSSKIWIWVLISVATILIVVAAVYFVLQKVEPKSEKRDSISQSSRNEQADSLEFTLDLKKNYVGTMKSENGSIQSVLLDIRSINIQLNSFEYTMNVGVQSKSVSTGSLDFIKSTIYSTEFGELSFRVQQQGRIVLINSNPNIYPKFELYEELK